MRMTLRLGIEGLVKWHVICFRSHRHNHKHRAKRQEPIDDAAFEERRVVFVGDLPDGYSQSELNKRFGGFGEIERVSIHKKQSGLKYGFVTFVSKADAYAAIASEYCDKRPIEF